MTRITAASEGEYALFPFYRDGRALTGGAARWGMTFRSAGSMRFRLTERNEIRGRMLQRIASECGGAESAPEPVAVELVHSKIVYDVKSPADAERRRGDGIITANPRLMPVVTVADCMPLYLYDPVTGVFGVVHSGWKGTGIAAAALNLAEKRYGTRPEDVCVAIGPHIRSCCYIVDKERAEYFASNFTPDCAERIPDGGAAGGNAPAWDSGGGPLFRLSLEKANLSVLAEAGVREENIVIAGDCTCCNPVFGSNRRETALTGAFTAQAAFVLSARA